MDQDESEMWVSKGRNQPDKDIEARADVDQISDWTEATPYRLGSYYNP